MVPREVHQCARRASQAPQGQRLAAWPPDRGRRVRRRPGRVRGRQAVRGCRAPPCSSPAGTSTRCAPGPTGSSAGSTARRPDVVCLQELKCTDEQFPSEPVRALGYHPALFGQKTYNGVAILARAEPERIERGFLDGEDDAAGPSAERHRRRRPRHLGLRAQRAGGGLARLPAEARLVRPVPTLARRAAPARTSRSSCAATSTWPPRSATCGTRSSGRDRRSSRCRSGRR